MSSIVKIVDGKEVDLQFSLNDENVPAAIEAITDLYQTLHERLPFIASVLRSCVGKASAGMDIRECALCTPTLGNLLAIVEHFIVTERDTIRDAYGELDELDEDDAVEAAPETGSNTYIPALAAALKHIEEVLDADRSNRKP
jgi:hypothetical protein